MFRFSDKHIEEFLNDGFTVFRNIVPPSLIDELRIECDRGVRIARERSGEQAQRFQPVGSYPINHRPFEEFQNLPAIRDAVSRVLPHEVETPDLSILGVLVEPAKGAWCTSWHRDGRDTPDPADRVRWEKYFRDLRLYNQMNCALYEDTCTWVVPGSHLRFDTDAEEAAMPTHTATGPNLIGASESEQERACLDYCRSMPGALRLHLDAGDYCLYRACLWHLGNYSPYRKRATLHDAVMTPAYRAWWNNRGESRESLLAAIA